MLSIRVRDCFGCSDEVGTHLVLADMPQPHAFIAVSPISASWSACERAVRKQKNALKFARRKSNQNVLKILLVLLEHLSVRARPTLTLF